MRHELVRRTVTVAAVSQPAPAIRRVEFTGGALETFVSLGFDDHVKLLLPTADGSVQGRDYTPRRHDRERARLTIDFALHADGPATRWARQAAPGQTLDIGGPRGSMLLPEALDWLVLAGDATALPAISRRIEASQPGEHLIVQLLLDASERPALDEAVALARARAQPARLEVSVHDAPGPWLSALSGQVLPAGSGFAWCAGEASLAAEVRRRLVDERGLHRHAVRASAYWKRGAQAHHATLET